MSHHQENSSLRLQGGDAQEEGEYMHKQPEDALESVGSSQLHQHHHQQPDDGEELDEQGFLGDDEEDPEEDEGDMEEMEGEEEEEDEEEEAMAALDGLMYNDADEEDEEDEEEEEIRLDAYVLPPMPPATAPPAVQGIPTEDVYSIIEELRRQMDDPVERERAKAMLKGDTHVLLAVAQVLQESKLLRRSVVSEQTGTVVEQPVPQPEAPLPQLPAGYHSWIYEDRGRRDGVAHSHRR